MRFLITGGSGYLAGGIAQTLLTCGEEVVLFTRNIIPSEERIDGLTYVSKSEFNSVTADAILGNVDVVVYCAGLNSTLSKVNPSLAAEVNSEGPFNFAQRCQGKIPTFIYVSTFHVYSSIPSGVISESTPPVNGHPYASTHLEGEQRLNTLSDVFPGGIFSVRLANTFGVPISDSSSGWELVVNSFAYQAVSTGKITIHSDPRIERNFIPLEMAAQRIYELSINKLRDKSATHFNIGVKGNLSLKSIAELIATEYQKIYGGQLEICYADDTDRSEPPKFEFKSSYHSFQDVDHVEAIRSLIYAARDRFNRLGVE